LPPLILTVIIAFVIYYFPLVSGDLKSCDMQTVYATMWAT